MYGYMTKKLKRVFPLSGFVSEWIQKKKFSKPTFLYFFPLDDSHSRSAVYVQSVVYRIGIICSTNTISYVLLDSLYAHRGCRMVYMWRNFAHEHSSGTRSVAKIHRSREEKWNTTTTVERVEWKINKFHFRFRALACDSIIKRNFNDTLSRSTYIHRRVRQSDGCQIHALGRYKHTHTVYIQVVSRIFNQMFSESRKTTKNFIIIIGGGSDSRTRMCMHCKESAKWPRRRTPFWACIVKCDIFWGIRIFSFSFGGWWHEVVRC